MKVKEWAAAVRWSSKAIGEGGYNHIHGSNPDRGHVDVENFVEEVKERKEAGERFESEMDDDEVECLISGLIYKVSSSLSQFYITMIIVKVDLFSLVF